MTCLVSGKRRGVELVRANRKTCWVRVPATGLRPSKVIKRHMRKHAVGS